MYSRYQHRKEASREFNIQAEQRTNDFAKLDSNHLIKLRRDPFDFRGYSKYMVLDKEGLFYVFDMDIGLDVPNVWAQFTTSKDSFPIVEISMELLGSTIVPRWIKMDDQEAFYKEIINDGYSYRISKIFDMDSPILIDNGSWGNCEEGVLCYNVTNKGSTGILTEINNIEGDLNWLNELPDTSFRSITKKYSQVNFKVDNFDRDKNYKFQYYLNMISGETCLYEVEILGGKRYMKRVQ